MELPGKTAIVTGGAGGIGRRVVERLRAGGARVAVFDLVTLPADDPDLRWFEVDVTRHDAVGGAVDVVREEMGEISILVNNAGMTEDVPLIRVAGGLQKHPPDVWDRVIATSLTSVFNVTVHVAAKMVMDRTHGVIVNVSSVSAQGNAGQTAYSAAKAGVEALAMTWARELNLLGIRVAAVAPGFTKTRIVEAMPPKVVAAWQRRIPLARLAEPAEIADGILFVIQNDYFNGRVLSLDGGLVM